MPSYKLTYFGMTGLGEFIRYLFSYGKIEFEDKRYTYEEWGPIKQTVTWGKMPLLEIDGVEYHQSLAIGRYLAEIVGISGEDALENFKINMVLDTFADFIVEVFTPFYTTDDTERENQFKNIFDNYIPLTMPKFEKLAKENNGYLALGRLTIADIYVASFNDYFKASLKRDIFEGYPYLQKVISNVENIPEIQNWIKNRSGPIAFDFADVRKLIAEM